MRQKRPHIGELEQRNEMAGGSSFASSSVKYSFMSSSAQSVLLACDSDELAVRKGHGAGDDDDHDGDDDHTKSTSTHFFYEVKIEAFNSHANLNDIVVHRSGLIGGNTAAGSETAVVEADVADPAAAADAAVDVNTEQQQQQQEHKCQEAEELELEELAREVHYLKEMISSSSDEKKSSNDDDDDNNDNSCSRFTAAMTAVAAADYDELNQALVASNVFGMKVYFDLLLGSCNNNNKNNTIGHVKQARTSSLRTACDARMYAKQLINEEQLKLAFIKNV